MANIIEAEQDNIPALSGDSIIAAAEQAEKRIAAVNKIKVLSLKVTNYHDWTDQGGKPYLQVSGAEKIARLFGISWRIDEPVFEKEEDGHFSYTYKGYFSMSGVTIEAIGTRSSKDPFFTRYSKERDENNEKVKLPPSETDKGDLKKAAYTNCIGNGISRLLGIRNMTWEEVRGGGVNTERVGKVAYGTDEARGIAPDAIKCPKCGGPVWDNREKKAKGTLKANAPDAKCKDTKCGEVIWHVKADEAPKVQGQEQAPTLCNECREPLDSTGTCRNGSCPDGKLPEE